VALLVDGRWCEAEELQAYDDSATRVAAEEGIDLGAKMALSEAWIADRVDDFLRWESNCGQSVYPRSGLSVENAVVDERLKRWHVAHTLALVYRDASFSQVNDRYQKKSDAFTKDATQSRGEYFEGGVPYVGNPLRKPLAPTVTVTDGDQSEAAYMVTTTQVDARGNESAQSEVVSIEAAAGNGLTVAANGLAAGNGWNVYMADSNGAMRRQNSAPLDANAVWALPEAGVVAGPAGTAGQAPEGRVKERRIVPRG
jgi:hypothetical protein